MKGGQCEQCGFDDARALRFHHVKPLRRTSNGLSKRDQTSTETHRAVVNGKAKGIRLLCANCSTIATAKDGTLNVNIKRAPKQVARCGVMRETASMVIRSHASTATLPRWSSIGWRSGPTKGGVPAGIARPHLLRVSDARKSVVAVTEEAVRPAQ